MGLVSSQVLILAPKVVDVGLLYGPEGVVAYLGYIMDEPCPQIQHWALAVTRLLGVWLPALCLMGGSMSGVKFPKRFVVIIFRATPTEECLLAQQYKFIISCE